MDKSAERYFLGLNAVGTLLKVFIDKASMTISTPDPGWYAAVELTDPKIKINYTP